MSVALEVALRRHAAWASGQFDLAMGYIADEIVGEAPAGRIDGIAQYREFMEPFVAILTGSSIIGAFGDDEAAVVVLRHGNPIGAKRAGR